MGGVPVGVDGVPVGVLPKAQASEGRRIVGDLGVRCGDLGVATSTTSSRKTWAACSSGIGTRTVGCLFLNGFLKGLHLRLPTCRGAVSAISSFSLFAYRYTTAAPIHRADVISNATTDRLKPV